MSSDTATGLTPAQQAQAALGLAQSDPSRSSALAREALRRSDDPFTVAVAERALGMAAKARQDWLCARDHLQRSIDIATASGAARVAAEARVSLGPVVWHLGDTPGALREFELAAPLVTGAMAARLELNRGFIAQREGRLDDALEIYAGALVQMRQIGDEVDEASLLTNRGILHAYRGQFERAEEDLLGAERIHAKLGHKLQACDVRHNLGFIAARKGDVPTALRRYDVAEREREALGVSAPQALLDRCDVLLGVRLVAEARRVARVAASRLAEARLEPELAEAHLILAEAALLDGDTVEARRVADLARSSFQRQRRLGWLALADYALLRADSIEACLPSDQLQVAALETARVLSAAGWVAQALDARIMAAEAALQSGALEAATAELQRAAAHCRWGPADVRARAWYAKALSCHAHQDRRGTQTALVAGMRVLSEARATLGATELRVHAAAQGQEMAALGIGVALDSGQPAEVLRWAERCRAMTALRERPPRPPADVDLASSLTQLRHVVSQVEQAAMDGVSTRTLLQRQARLEAEIRRRSRHTPGERYRTERVPTIAELRRALGETVLVEMVESGDRLYAVTLTDRRVRLHALAATPLVAARTSTLRFALGRLANGRSSPASTAAARTLAEITAGELDGLLFGPLRGELGDHALVIVPTGVLHALPWATLPSCRQRPVSVCPSAALWMESSARWKQAGRSGTLLVAGPGLTDGPAEVDDLSRVYPDATMLVGAQATSTEFLRAAAAAELVHVAAHGSFRADNPLLSSLRLVDGPLTVYDLEGFSRSPRCLVLSACEGGLSAVRPGEELMGLSAALLRAGSSVLVASVTPARDSTTRTLMVEFHRRLQAGHDPARSLAEAQRTLSENGADEPLAAAGFVCFGGGLAAR